MRHSVGPAPVKASEIHPPAEKSCMKPVIYQLVVRYFGNTRGANVVDGDIHENGCGQFADINDRAIAELGRLGVTHVWLTGVLRQATLTDHSSIGLPPDPPDIVKGRAGSFYAVRDCVDVCPDYAVHPERRMAEFEALLGRIHAAGLRVLIDLVPNHVSRNHASDAECFDFGRGDDQSQFFTPTNNFYYLVDPPGRALTLPKPAHWNPPGVVFGGPFEREDGRPGHTPKATGGDDYTQVVQTQPSENIWYETIKLNYGYDFRTQQGHYDPLPRTWRMVDALIAFWQRKGVDGFRCDFAHYVPSEAWAYLIGRARQPNAAAFFMAESYPYPGSADPVHHQSQLIDAGFDAVYHSRAYDALKRIYQGHGVDAYEREMSALDDRSRPHYLEYLENHDERRIPSPIVAHASPGDSGFGSSHAAHQLAPLQLLYSQGPVLVLNGQEVGEPGAGATGFKGDNGRTTLFDYWRMPSFARWVNDHAYDGGQLDSGSAALRRYYRDLLGLCQHPSITGSGYWSLGSRHGADHGPGVSKWLYAFARYAPGSGRLVLVVANFRPDSAEAGQLRVPRELTRAAGVADGTSLHVRLILNEAGAQNDAGPTLSVEALALGGFDARVANQSCNVYALDVG
jgi:glycosidase